MRDKYRVILITVKGDIFVQKLSNFRELKNILLNHMEGLGNFSGRAFFKNIIIFIHAAASVMPDSGCHRLTRTVEMSTSALTQVTKCSYLTSPLEMSPSDQNCRDVDECLYPGKQM